MTTTPKKGDRVRVMYEAKYYANDGAGWHSVSVGGALPAVPPHATIEVIEEPYEEGAIYESCTGGKFLYLPDGSEKPWVFIHFDGYTSGDRIGDRVRRVVGARKLVPSE